MGTKLCVDCFCYDKTETKITCTAKKVTMQAPYFVKETPGDCGQWLDRTKLSKGDEHLVDVIHAIESSTGKMILYEESVGMFLDLGHNFSISYEKQAKEFLKHLGELKPVIISRILLRQEIDDIIDVKSVENYVYTIVGKSTIKFQLIDEILRAFECKEMLATDKQSPIVLRDDNVWIMIAPCVGPAYDTDMYIPSFEVHEFLKRLKQKDSKKKSDEIFNHFWNQKKTFVPQDTLDDLK